MAFEVYLRSDDTYIARLNGFQYGTVAFKDGRARGTRVYLQSVFQEDIKFIGFGYDPDDTHDFEIALRRAKKMTHMAYGWAMREFKPSIIGYVAHGKYTDIILHTEKRGVISIEIKHHETDVNYVTRPSTIL